MRLTKTDFVDFRTCSKAHWLKRHKPDVVEWPALTEYDQLQMKLGYEVERLAKQYMLATAEAELFSFQDVFETEDGLYARADMVRNNENGTLDIFEVKSSTALKDTSGHDHIDDATFQTVVAERWGADVRNVYIVHVRKDYIRRGIVDPNEFLVFVDVTEDVRHRYNEIADAADQALRFVNEEEIDESFCDCRLKSRGNHCAAFRYFNTDIKDPSIYIIPRLMKAKKFAERGITSIFDVPDQELTAKQLPTKRAAESGQPEINRPAIRRFLDELQWPLYFYDYETVSSPIPRSDGLSPHQQMPVQFSLHVMKKDGTLSHAEYLSMTDGDHEALVQALKSNIGPVGSLLAWNKKFEIGCNNRLAKLLPHHVHFLQDMSHRTVDLMDPFVEDYVDIRFGGSTSIKKVLPILCPDLSYNENGVNNGGMAIAAWIDMAETINEHERERHARDLREYCEMDTYAMVRIFEVLRGAVSEEQRPERPYW